MDRRDPEVAPLGTPARPLYFLHIPRTGGSALTRLLEDAFPAGTVCPLRRAQEISGVDDLLGYGVLAGHHGLLPLHRPTIVALTLLRDPVERAWSHYRALLPDGTAPRAAWLRRPPSFAEVLATTEFGAIADDHQATWLAVPAQVMPGHNPAELPDPRSPHLEPLTLARRARATLDRCALVGTTERLLDFTTALGRMLGRWLPPPPRVNAGSRRQTVAVADAAEVLRRSAIDVALHAEADRRLDLALAELPPVPPEPLTVLPYRQTMADPLAGTGWHARVDDPVAGWHRWTGPGTESVTRLPVRPHGRARLELAIVSACDDDAVRSLRIAVQDRPVRFVLEPRDIGVVAVGDVDIDPRLPVTLTLSIDHARHLVDPATGRRSPDPAGLAIGDLRLLPCG